MSNCNRLLESEMQHKLPLLTYGCAPWRLRTQRVSDLYDGGTKLWTKGDLVDIERQLEQSATLERFTLRCVDGTQVQVKNPFFGAQTQVWKPFVRFQDYWKLVLSDGGLEPQGTLYCSYLIDWKNQLARDFRGNIEDWTKLANVKKQLWDASITCGTFKSGIRNIAMANQVSKVVCFGLGDFARRPPETASLRTGMPIESESDGAEVDGPMMQHAVALTMAEELRQIRGGKAVRLLAQDPQYSDDTKDFLTAQGFEIVGNFGAGGFEEVDNQSIVFTAWVAAPVKQIIADLASPAAFITVDSETLLNSSNNPVVDGESPRTIQMWRDYERWNFPVSPVEDELMQRLRGLKIFARRQTDVLPK